MKQFLLDLLSEQSKISTMRLMSLMCALAAIGLAFYGIDKGQQLDALSILCGVFLGAAFGGKVSQKAFERAANSASDNAPNSSN